MNDWPAPDPDDEWVWGDWYVGLQPPSTFKVYRPGYCPARFADDISTFTTWRRQPIGALQ